jgi:hypothetical protein
MRAGCRPGEDQARAHMRFVFQTMMSSRIRPKSSRGSRQNPSIHDVRLPPRSLRTERKLVCFPRSRGMASLEEWWSQTGSNRRPHACKARALPTELWPLVSQGGRPQLGAVIDPSFARPRVTQGVVGPGGLEPPTSRLSGVCSNQLSYRP